jgi:2-polyprenyl-6-hydroxyphenyl methylase/3-demethylubiquinone-9 3-methyltransferase
MSEHAVELSRGERFPFGKNWSRYLEGLTSAKIAQATESLRAMLSVADLKGKRFVDVGSGSGLFSLAARKLGASVHSFDYDPESVGCTVALREEFFPADSEWTVQEASILDRNYLLSIGRFDVVYSWGVLHHTGAMWEALANITRLATSDGKVAIAIYNDQGRMSNVWRTVKRSYCGSPAPLKQMILAGAFIRLWGPTMLRDLLSGRPGATWQRYRNDHERGMSPWRDVVDWVGGYPFEVAKPEQMLEFFRAKGFELTRLRTCGGGLGCNEYVFSRLSGRE